MNQIQKAATPITQQTHPKMNNRFDPRFRPRQKAWRGDNPADSILTYCKGDNAKYN
jgi:hypothetical protein